MLKTQKYKIKLIPFPSHFTCPESDFSYFDNLFSQACSVGNPLPLLNSFLKKLALF